AEALDNGDLAGAASAVADYTQLLRQHIEKEDNVLYAMAERMPTRTELARMEKEFERVEAEDMGVGSTSAITKWPTASRTPPDPPPRNPLGPGRCPTWPGPVIGAGAWTSLSTPRPSPLSVPTRGTESNQFSETSATGEEKRSTESFRRCQGFDCVPSYESSTERLVS
ncbi:MAG: hypothetical protein C4551_01575, partial [Bacillota bacterium]